MISPLNSPHLTAQLQYRRGEDSKHLKKKGKKILLMQQLEIDIDQGIKSEYNRVKL